MRKLLTLALLMAALGLRAQIYNDYMQGVRMPKKPATSNFTDYSRRDRGFWCAGQIGATSSVRIGGPNLQTVGFDYIFGYRLSQWVRLGLGLGGRAYVHNNDVRDKSAWTMPIYAHARGNFMRQGTRMCVPFWGMSIGGTVNDGFFLSPQVGLRVGEPRSSFTVAVAYQWQQIDCSHVHAVDYNFMQLTLGYEF